jgi:tetratricopeptide (TPR) repeat protein
LSDYNKAEQNFKKIIELTKELDLISLNIKFKDLIKSKGTIELSNSSDKELISIVAFISASWLLKEIYAKYTDNKKQAISIMKGLLKIDPENTGYLNNIAILYLELGNYNQAVKYFKKSISYNDITAKSGFAFALFLEGKDINQALKYAEDVYKTNKNQFFRYLLSMIWLWNDQYCDSFSLFVSFLDKYRKEIPTRPLGDYFELLLAKGQYQLAIKLFKQFPETKEEIKPIYYALMNLVKQDYPKEYLKMGSELESTVDEVLKRIKVLSKKYQ